MVGRCHKENDDNYKNYGAKGIKVCDEWRNDFLEFEKWALINGYDENLSIDRIDVRKDYTPKIVDGLVSIFNLIIKEVRYGLSMMVD